MTVETYSAAKDCGSRIARLKLMIRNCEALPRYVNDADIAEAPETTAAMKQLLLTDLRARLAAEEAAFAAL